MTADQGPAVQGALLRNELIRLRKSSELTQEQVANDLEWSTSKLIRVEGGKSAITKVDLDALLKLYGVTSESLTERLHGLNRGAREPGWWAAYRNDMSPTYLTYVGYEAGASSIRQFNSSVIPGLLQTEEYAEVLTVGTATTPLKVAPTVNLRMQRQREMRKRDTLPRRFFVVDEAVIRRHIGITTNPAIMPRQLRSIADECERDDLLNFRVIPFKAGGHPGLNAGPFTILEFGGGLADVLYLDSGGPSITMITGDDTRVADHADTFELIQETALTVDESLALLRRTAEEMS